MSEEIRIYVADLAAYNNGKLHGVWIDATEDPDTIQDQINDMLAKSPEPDSEEWAIHDYEGFDGYKLSEYQGIESVHEIAWLISDYPSVGAALLIQFNGDVEEARTAYDDNYRGCYSSVADFAQDLTEETTTEIPKHLEHYIDYESMGRDMELSGDIFTIETGYNEVHVFWNH